MLLYISSNTFQNIFDDKNMDGIMDNASSSKQNFLNDKNASDFKSSLSEAFPFRGFSESEISMIPNHVKNVIYLYNRIIYDFFT